MMPDATLKIHLFRIEAEKGSDPLENLLRRIKADALEERIRNCTGVEYRLEDIKPPAKNTTWWELNFVRLRDGHGPGKVSRKSAMKGFRMAPGDYFGEDTAVLYDESTRFAIVQYNHWGVRPSGIEQYLSAYRSDVTNIYSLNVKLDLSAERRFNKQEIQRRIEIGIDCTQMSADDLKARRSLLSLAKIGQELGADRLHLTVSIASGARDNGLRKEAKEMVNSALKRLGNKGALRNLVSYGTPDANKPFEEIDLLEEKLEEAETLRVGADRRISLSRRIDALKRARIKWKGKITKS